MIVLRCLPGKSRKIDKRTPGLKPEDSAGFDSHLSVLRLRLLRLLTAKLAAGRLWAKNGTCSTRHNAAQPMC